MAWIILFIAGCFEVAWAIGLKYSDGFKKPGWSIFTVVCIIISMGMLAWCLKHLPVGTAYVVWTGIGAIGTAVLGILLFHESADIMRIFFLFLIIAGIAGIRFVS